MYSDIKDKFKELEKQLSDPQINTDPQKLAQIGKKHAVLKQQVELIDMIEKIQAQIKENTALIEQSKDKELVDLAETELPQLESKYKEAKKDLDAELNPANPNDKKDIIMEIRAGTGGDESALFAADLFRMYSRFAENKGWKINILNTNRIGIGGFKEIIFEINGKNVYQNLKFEAGTHRVQRVPETEKQGRVHTSAATVAVIPQAEDVDIEIRLEDLRIDTYAASGPGGQKVNTTNSAVRITHVPSGLVVQCQDQNSQHQNKDKALQVLKSRLYQKMEDDRMTKEAAERKQMIGTGDRSEKIRTYNFPQDRITDHRVKKNWSNIESILAGNLDDIIQSLQSAVEA